MSTFSNWLVGVVFDCLMGMIGYPVGRLLLPLVSLGRARAERLTGPIRPFNWFGYRRDESGRIEIEAYFTSLIGLAACLLGVACLTTFLHLVR